MTRSSAVRVAAGLAEQIFRLLALCTQRPGHPQVVARLPQALSALPPGVDLVAHAVEHGLAPLLLAHVRAAKAAVAPSVGVRLYAQHAYHTHVAVVRRRIVAEIVEGLTGAGIPLLVLKGAALAQLVYEDPARRPMRDVDLLVPRAEARRASGILRGLGLTRTERPTAPGHHHLPAMMKTEDGATIVVEVHRELLAHTPFVAPLTYDDLRPAAQEFNWGGVTLQTLGREDMLWHVYAHAFVVNTLSPGMPLISLADLMHVTEAWADVLDWDDLRHRYRRMVRALPLVHHLTPWSASLADRLGGDTFRPVSTMPAVSSALHWSDIASRDVLWPAEWWFRMRYGIDGQWRWLWYRSVGHPLRVGMSAVGTASRRISSHRRGAGPQ